MDLERALLADDDDGDNEEEEEEEEEARRPEDRDAPEKIALFSLTSATVIAVGCLGMIEYSMVMPSLAKYVKELGQTNVFYGACQAVFSLSRLVFMPVLGRWSDRRPMIEPFLFCIVAAMAGNVIYGLAYGLRNAWLILLARVLVGMGAANATLTMSFVARITAKETRTRALAMLNGFNLIGVVIGPATNLLVADVRYTFSPAVVLNELTNPGWLMVVLLVALLVLTLATFNEPPPLTAAPTDDCARPSAASIGSPFSVVSLRRQSVVSILSDETSEPMLNTPLLQQQAAASGATVRGLARNILHYNLWVHFIISFCGNFVLNELDTALPALTAHDFGWDAIANSYAYAGLGLTVAATLVFVVVTTRFISDRAFIGAGLTLMLLDLIVDIAFCRHTPGMPVFVVCVFLLASATPIVGSPNMSLFSKRLEEEDSLAGDMGLYIGLLQGTNGLSRVFAPLYAGFALLNLEDHLHVYTGPLVVVSVALLVYAYKFHTIRERSLLV